MGMCATRTRRNVFHASSHVTKSTTLRDVAWRFRLGVGAPEGRGGGYWGGQVGGGTSTNLEFDESDEPDHDVELDDVEDCVPLLSPLDEEGDEGEARRRLL